MLATLPKPTLDARHFGAHRLCMLTDDALFKACGVRIGFTKREGGASTGAYASLNLGIGIGDDEASVDENCARLMDALDATGARLINPKQVHGTDIAYVDSRDEEKIAECSKQAEEGIDAVVVEVKEVAALLKFADCTPVVIVSPSGRFALAHAGWRGAVAGIAGKTARALLARDKAAGVEVSAADYNAYIGPHIRSECFECGEEVAESFSKAFGREVVPDSVHVSLAAAVSCDLVRAGLDAERIADSGICTKCHADEFFSYRATGGVCGRHGAIAIARERGRF